MSFETKQLRHKVISRTIYVDGAIEQALSEMALLIPFDMNAVPEKYFKSYCTEKGLSALVADHTQFTRVTIGHTSCANTPHRSRDKNGAYTPLLEAVKEESTTLILQDLYLRGLVTEHFKNLQQRVVHMIDGIEKVVYEPKRPEITIGLRKDLPTIPQGTQHYPDPLFIITHSRAILTETDIYHLEGDSHGTPQNIDYLVNSRVLEYYVNNEEIAGMWTERFFQRGYNVTIKEIDAEALKEEEKVIEL